MRNHLPRQGVSRFTYTYDDSGRITEVRAGGTLRYKYVYDESGQVALDYNFTNNTATKYVYDANGNILQKTPYTNVTTTDLSTATQGTAISYTYDSNWGDKLVSYNGQSIVYDSIGNPTTYRGATLTWTGRMLSVFEKTIDNSNHRYEYSYDKDGLRTVKKHYIDNVLQNVTTYIWKDKILVGSNITEPNGNTLLNVKYVYNGEELVAINLNGSVLLVEKNLQGDITGLYSPDYDEKLFEFYYDAYGNISISQGNSLIGSVFETLTVACTNVNYRGYYYDFDTGLYYLQSRYYDPQTGRFISLDDTQFAISTAGTPLGSNLYAYCYNNPVNASDPTGELAEHCDFAQFALSTVINGLLFTFATQKSILVAPIILFVFGFHRDFFGNYHANFVCWQWLAGYNDFYDTVFNVFTKMERKQFFYTYKGFERVIWAWKGYYFNLGAGAEVGLYTDAIHDGWAYAWNGDALHMGLDLFRKNKYGIKHLIGSYHPLLPQWWVTVFNPNHQCNVLPEDLYVVCIILFDDAKRFDAFKKEVCEGDNKDIYKPYWTFCITKKSATLRF